MSKNQDEIENVEDSVYTRIDPLYVFENERWFPGRGWGVTLPTERHQFSNGDGSWDCACFPAFALDWELRKDEFTDDHGWEYATNFTSFTSATARGVAKTRGCYVRRRKYFESKEQAEERVEEFKQKQKQKAENPLGNFNGTVFENERWYLGKGWSGKLLPTERNRWSNGNGSFSTDNRPSFMSKQTWTLYKDDLTDDAGWEYAFNWPTFNSIYARGSTKTAKSMVRRRRWITNETIEGGNEFETDTNNANPIFLSDSARSAQVETSIVGGVFDFVNNLNPLSTSGTIGKCKRQRVVDQNDWENLFDNEGVAIDSDLIKKRIFEGGLSPELRKDAWPLLLGVYPWNSDYNNRNVSYRSMKGVYDEMLAQFKADDSEKCNDIREQIDKDVNRVDRDSCWFGGDGNANMQILRNILGTFCICLRPGQEYHQAMCEVAATLIIAIGDESLVFWSFAKQIEKTKALWTLNEGNNKSIDLSLDNLIKGMVGHFDPPLYQHLEKIGSDDALFTYRWLLLNMKHEFTRSENLTLQEVCWSFPFEVYENSKLELASNPYIMFVALSAILQSRSQLFEIDDYFEVCEYMSSLKGKIQLNTVLEQAEWLFWMYCQSVLPADRKLK